MTENRRISDFNAVVAGQGGDGSLTVATILTEMLARRGYHLFKARNVASRIKGGPAAAMFRGSLTPRGGLGDHFDLLVAFDQEVVDLYADKMATDGIIIHDASDGPINRSALPPTISVFEVPFGRYAVRDLSRDLFKNSLSFGVISRALSLGETEAVNCLSHTLRRLPPRLLEPNLQAFRLGLEFADEIGLIESAGPWTMETAEREKHLLINGNEALAFGFMAAGGKFYAGYPITPATEILEFLQRHLPARGGVVLQAEDELAAVNMAIGAAMTGTRAMTGSSSPGYSLMQEGIVHAGSAEIPLVIVDSQRSGPSTGMPTKPEQSDIDMMVYGGNGDFPRIVLAPGDPKDCFELSVMATNLAQQLQCPVIIALDQAIAQDSRTVDFFDLDAVEANPGKRLTAAEIEKMDEYRRYEVTPDGVSPWAVPGTPGGMNLITGNERNEWGLVSTKPDVRQKMADKRTRKIDEVRSQLPTGRRFGDQDAEIAVIGIGMQTGVMEEAVERLQSEGLAVSGLQPRTLWPVHEETLAFIAGHRCTYIIEHNSEGQLIRLLMGAGAYADRVDSIRKYDGVPFRPSELVEIIRTREATAADGKIGNVA
jgi:2-oxoglutarate/2-oxoacid ferredoxin oxidoreductase subunit alpha